MGPHVQQYIAMISTDWNECLAPTGPFDPVTFTHPQLGPELEKIFRLYTANRITLAQAIKRLQDLLPEPLTQEQMDAYLDTHFRTYKGVPEFMNWCAENRILFMINTTAAIGFFQRVFAKGLLPRVPALSGHPIIHYPHAETDPSLICRLLEIDDKPKNTQQVAQAQGIPSNRIIIIGDSGGDGPHFEWGASVGAHLVGSMTKWSLENYCQERGIKIHSYFGLQYGKGEARDVEKEMVIDFFALKGVIKDLLAFPNKAES